MYMGHIHTFVECVVVGGVVWVRRARLFGTVCVAVWCTVRALLGYIPKVVFPGALSGLILRIH